ncbi:MAG: hypothetical protein PHX39_13895 [Bacteroidales bacterium]|nr:hypothetical protein [Bacteroidales bacterium]MDY0279126.1 hypothetical protein [Salinivirgaceae bacterium]
MSKAGFIEAWSRGIAKIINGFINAGLAAPVFETTMGGVRLTTPARDYNNTSDVSW